MPRLLGHLIQPAHKLSRRLHSRGG